MTPNIITEAHSHSFGSRMTVAQRKEAHELRKTLKPLMEKRRRARINESLNNLKTLILPLVGKDASRYSKLEKADILEMTVRFLRDLPSSSAKGQTDSYNEGYKACLQRISTLLPQSNLDTDTHHRVNEFIQHSMVSATSACQNCCAQSSRMVSEMHQRLVSIRNNISATANHTVSTASASSQPQPEPQAAADMWRPW
ncbi:transcription factor HES-2.1 [Xyrauchen texanus]|uniref:transcription factor HES-2.1 n=1 Tax=Xyrauchen texanus TaxID=154827 RepID=UPI00224276BA|nr:transcription factor HES-2.1 [Xyrauchen texanus]